MNRVELLFLFKANEASRSPQCKTMRGSSRKPREDARIAAIRFRSVITASEGKKLNSPTHLAASSELVRRLIPELGAQRGLHGGHRSVRSARHRGGRGRWDEKRAGET
jgi:hypothetical protein